MEGRRLRGRGAITVVVSRSSCQGKYVKSSLKFFLQGPHYSSSSTVLRVSADKPWSVCRDGK